VLDACRKHGIGLVPYFPLESGLLTGKYRKGAELPDGSRLQSWKDLPHGAMFLTEEMFDAVEALIAHAEAQGRSILELAMSWLARRPSIPTIITGATTPEQVAANAAAMQWDLDEGLLGAIDELRPS
jgi:aryl-alcohol dehydrogenase-like predicted oxidoreductase